MKKLSTLILAIGLLIQLNCVATIRTVNNNNPSPGQYSTFSAAVAAAVNNDTLYISGSPTAYSGSATNKTFTIIGTGHNPDKQNPLVSTFSSIDWQSGSNASCKLIGLSFTGAPILSVAVLTFEHCKFAVPVQLNVSPSTFTFNKCVFTGNAVTASGLLTYTCIFNNCIFNNAISTASSFALTGQANNCLFLGNAVTSVANNLSSFSFNYCIFYGTSPQISGTNSGNAFRMCLSFNCPNNNFGASNVSCIVNQDPLFISFVPANFHYTDNYILLATSPGHLYNNGQDIGLYGGVDIYFHMGGEPTIPQIRQMNITTTTLPSGTPVNVNIISTRKAN